MLDLAGSEMYNCIYSSGRDSVACVQPEMESSVKS